MHSIDVWSPLFIGGMFVASTGFFLCLIWLMERLRGRRPAAGAKHDNASASSVGASDAGTSTTSKSKADSEAAGKEASSDSGGADGSAGDGGGGGGD